MLEMGHVLPLAYRARRLAFGDPDVHLAYLHLFLRREDADRESLEPAAIGADCTVQLKRNNETRRFTILGEESVDGDRGELRIDDSLARKLLGKRKGDLVRVKDTPLEQVEYEIVEVQSKYVAAFQETMSGFSTWFPDHPALHRVDVRDGDFSKMTMLLDARQKRIFEVMRLYRDGRITLGAFAGMVGSDLTELWAGMISRPDGIVMAATGTVEDIRRDAKHVGNAKELVFDLTALLTLAYLGLLERVAAAMERVIVPQAVLDDLNEKLANDFVGPRPSMTVWKEGDRYLRHETTPEALERGRQFLRGIRSFIETHAELAPAEGVLEFDQTKIKELQQILGRSATAAILVARSRGTLLYSDDLGLRAVARNDWQVEGCWTQAILARLHESSAISEDEYHEAVVKLAIGNYHFVSINSGDLLWVLRRDDLKASHTVAHMLGLLGGPECSEETAVPIVADCIRAVWLENILFDEKLAILDLAMACLTKGRMVGGIVERLKAALRTRFALFPLAIPVIFRSIDLWASQRLLEGGRFQSRSIS